MTLIAVDVGGTTVKVEVLDEHGRVLRRATVPTPAAGGSTVTTVVVDLVAEFATPTDPVGLAVPGVVDRHAGVVRQAANLGWRDEPVVAAVAEATSTRPVLVHDVTAAGRAEHLLGAAKGHPDTAVVVIGTGIAAALVVDGRLVEHRPVGELGHLALAPVPQPCACGRTGCLEAVASARAIRDRYVESGGELVSGAGDVLARVDHDPIAREVWDIAIEALAEACLTLAMLLGTRRVVIGGGLANAGAPLLEAVATEAARRATVVPPPEVVVARFGDRAGLVGAALAAGLDPTRVAVGDDPTADGGFDIGPGHSGHASSNDAPS